MRCFQIFLKIISTHSVIPKCQPFCHEPLLISNFSKVYCNFFLIELLLLTKVVMDPLGCFFCKAYPLTKHPVSPSNNKCDKKLSDRSPYCFFYFLLDLTIAKKWKSKKSKMEIDFLINAQRCAPSSLPSQANEHTHVPNWHGNFQSIGKIFAVHF